MKKSFTQSRGDAKKNKGEEKENISSGFIRSFESHLF